MDCLLNIAQKYNPLLTSLAATAAIGGLIFLGYQAKKLKENIDLNLKSFSLEQRPYIYLYLQKVFNYTPSGDMFGGGYLFFENEGKIPASNVKLDFKVASDSAGEINVKKWFEDVLGGFAEVRTIFPHQKDLKVYIHPSIGKAKFFFIDIVVTYTGTEDKREYWYRLQEVYNLKGDGSNVEAIAIKTDTDWDNNKDNNKPEISLPDFNKYKDYLGR